MKGEAKLFLFAGNIVMFIEKARVSEKSFTDNKQI